MKKFLSAIFISLLFCSCVGLQPVEPVDPVCPQPNSWICEKSAEIGIYPETVYDWIYSAVALGALSDIVEIAEICDFEKEVADFYVRNYPQLSHDTLINEIFRQADMEEPEKAILIKNILNKNLAHFRSPKPISKEDDAIFRKGHVAFRRDMLCY